MSYIPTYPSPLAGYTNAPPLPDERNEDGKSYKNPPREGRSEAYDRFVEPLDNGRRGGFDVHIYYYQNNKEQTEYAHQLWERIRREFQSPNSASTPSGTAPSAPHPVAMFEVNLFTPAQFGAFIAWLAVWRGPLSALVHPNTVLTADERAAGVDEMEVEKRDHSERAIWMGERIPLDFALFNDAILRRRRNQQQQQQ
ncbi:DOPA-like domain protein [Apiospora rasikravindrae]|uniref:DOPA-like domain protein n=1 Tax=Apiospora rasikravindrae TaxID=990691 RepID=A0ABR1SD56_9PEZI